jgi:hypothetical protein
VSFFAKLRNKNELLCATRVAAPCKQFVNASQPRSTHFFATARHPAIPLVILQGNMKEQTDKKLRNSKKNSLPFVG